ncbi:hypothetical protein B0H17DRAFT_1200186 [Mycena rosella]|uniref:Uncharacterized protein n=1 Tax=Mycena rosella TaxID=1033263 RepID=A0AAD7GK55_MYCRO|nr:hypothetical protein B0H17DRAFT_1200186 [Mycena rosella]
MYTLVFLTRYLDLGMRFVSVYNTVLKIVYITNGSAGSRYFAHSCLPVLPLFNYGFTLTEILWFFSIALESVCVVPQLILLRQTTVPTVITSRYLLALGSRSHRVLCGLVQTVFYLDFAWVYYSRQQVKLRNGVLVDSEDFEHGWLV